MNRILWAGEKREGVMFNVKLEKIEELWRENLRSRRKIIHLLTRLPMETFSKEAKSS